MGTWKNKKVRLFGTFTGMVLEHDNTINETMIERGEEGIILIDHKNTVDITLDDKRVAFDVPKELLTLK